MRPPILGRRRPASAKDTVIYGFLLIAVVFLLYSLHSKLELSKPSDKVDIGREGGAGEEEEVAMNEDSRALANGESAVFENEPEFFSEKDFDSTAPSKERNRGGFPRILCMVPSQPHAREKFRTILDTWGQWCDGIRFMIDPPVYCEPGKEASQPDEPVEEIASSDGKVTGKIVLLNKLVRKKGNDCYTGGTEFNPITKKHEPVFTACRHIWEKVWRSWVYVSDHLAENFDFFFKVDDDTFFFVPTMREVLIEKGFKADEFHYFGQRVYPIGPDRPLIAGALVGWSRATLKRVVQEYKAMPHEYGDRRQFKHGRCVDRDGATEEVTTSICLRQAGIHAEAFYDETVVPRRPHVLLWHPRDMLTFVRRDNSSSWFYKHAPRDVGTLENCCSERPVAFHFMRTDNDLRRVYNLIVDPTRQNELEEMVEKQVPQWRAMDPAKRSRSGIDKSPYSAHGCALEAEYWLKVKKRWHMRNPKDHERRLTD